MAKAAELGKAFLDGVLSKITDPGLREAAARAFADPLVLTEIGGGVAGQQEIDRQLQALRTQTEELEAKKTELDTRDAGLTQWQEQLGAWRNTHAAALEEWKTMKASGAKPAPKAGDPPPAAAGLTPEQLDERLAQERAAFLGYDRDRNQILREHFGKFNEVVDLDALVQHPQIASLGLKGVYELVYKDRLTKHTADQQAAHDKAIADKAVRDFQASQAQMPYPQPTGAGSGSPLDALKPTTGSALVDQAVAEYHRLQAERAAGRVPA